jgi:hypothetical protein
LCAISQPGGGLRPKTVHFWVGSTAKKKLKIWVLGCYIG